MELKDYIYLGIAFIGVLGIVGALVMDSAYNYDKNVSDDMSLLLVGQNYSEFVQVEDLTTSGSITASDYADYQVGSDFDLFSKQTLTKMKTIITKMGTFMEIDSGVVKLILALLIAGVTIGGIYFLRNR